METILTQGINVLQKSDGDIEELIASRKNDVVSLLERYIKEIETFNSAYGLVGVSDTRELVIKHILDSLAPLGIIRRLLRQKAANENIKIADAGSGAGLPGIPLAITMPDFRFTLIERMGRRAGFLYNTTALLGLSNITVEEKEFEKTEEERFDLITFRAFSPIEPKLLKTLYKACSQTGVIAAYKGRREKIKQEMNFTQDWEMVPYSVPFLDEQRHLLVIKKPN